MKFQFDEYVEAMCWFGYKREKAIEILDKKVKNGNPMPDSLVREWKKNRGGYHG